MEVDGWKSVKLDDASEIKGGTTPSKSESKYWTNGDIPWATPTDITALGKSCIYITDTENKITNTALKETSLNLIPRGNVLMTSRATIGLAVVNDVPITTNQGFAIFFPKAGTLDSHFLTYWLRYKKPFMEQISGGSTFLEISKKSLKSMDIELPPLPEQKKIAEILGSVDDAILANQKLVGFGEDKQRLGQLQRIKKGLMSDLLSGRVRVNVDADREENAA